MALAILEALVSAAMPITLLDSGEPGLFGHWLCELRTILRISMLLLGTNAESFDRMKRNPTFVFCNPTFLPTCLTKNILCGLCSIWGSVQGDCQTQTARFADTIAQNASKAACHRPRNQPLEPELFFCQGVATDLPYIMAHIFHQPKLCMGQSIAVGTLNCVIKSMTGTQAISNSPVG